MPPIIGKLIDTIAARQPDEVKALIRLLEIAATENREEYRQIVHKELGQFPRFEERKSLLEAGHFCGMDFLQLVHSCGGVGAGGNRKGGTSLQVVTAMLHQLEQWMLISDNGLLSPNAYARYQWNQKRIAAFSSLNILDNVLLGPGFVAQKYSPSVPPIFVKKGDDERTGTGFLASSRFDATGRVIVTAKHNVDRSAGIKFLSFGETSGASYVPLSETWFLHPELDLAAMPVSWTGSPTPIYPLGTPTVLSRTISLGYPRIATTDGPYLLAHGGELNAVVGDYYGEKRLVISNLVAPGNSGGPVLDEAGLCVGMVTNAFETEHEGGVSISNAAIPADAILTFIAQLVSSK